ncbi:hypothetical protein L484_006980 [Morus notabilis]|uniref:Uncharacterized protein n=1 Tax=Morus notabilis TaxID=981085 RepID=W9SEG8_9ROSA|nr:hypothetical protein L484_006980 [Morus notabilis]
MGKLTSSSGCYVVNNILSCNIKHIYAHLGKARYVSKVDNLDKNSGSHYVIHQSAKPPMGSYSSNLEVKGLEYHGPRMWLFYNSQQARSGPYEKFLIQKLCWAKIQSK